MNLLKSNQKRTIFGTIRNIQKWGWESGLVSRILFFPNNKTFRRIQNQIPNIFFMNPCEFFSLTIFPTIILNIYARSNLCPFSGPNKKHLITSTKKWADHEVTIHVSAIALLQTWSQLSRKEVQVPPEMEVKSSWDFLLQILGKNQFCENTVVSLMKCSTMKQAIPLMTHYEINILIN